MNCQYDQCDDVHKKVAECRKDHYKEGSVVEPAHAIINPHAVMVKILHAPIAGPAVPRSILHEAVTVVAEKKLDCVCLAKLLESA